MTTITRDELLALCESAAIDAGATPGSARHLAEATVEAEQVGASLRTDQGGIIVGEGGRRFVHGREIVE